MGDMADDTEARAMSEHEFYDDSEDEIVEKYRNWPIYEDVGGELFVTITGDELYCTNIKDAHKEIDKAIKKWGKRRALTPQHKSKE
jgi:enolase